MADDCADSDFGAMEALGDVRLRDRLLSTYYEEFRRIARRVLAVEHGRLSVQPTELAHEAAIRILSSQELSVRDHAHFLALGVRVMRQTLIDEVRRHKAAKRGADVLTEWRGQEGATPLRFDIEDFDRSLDRLSAIRPEGAQIVELRFYAGLTLEEIADTLATSLSTVNRRWRSARAWLLKEMQVAA